jgi:hypothetical protein
MQISFCSECGAKLTKSDIFCSNCGTKAGSEIIGSNSSVKPDNTVNEDDKTYNSFGYIFTNLAALSESFSCDVSEIEVELTNYVNELKKISHHYILIDAANNDFKNLTPDDSWQTHIDLLKRVINETNNSPFLFIAGGHEVIPVPCIINEPGVYVDDEEIYSDLPYNYLESARFSELLWNGQLMCQEVKCHVGRFPTGKDVRFNDLFNYLTNAKKGLIDNQISFKSCFGISTLKWKITSEEVVSKIYNITNLNLSPEVGEENIDNIFSTKSDIYFYNLHGSDSPGAACYFGDDGRINPKAIFPHNMASAQKLNILLTEACYGGRFIGYDKDDSMLLTSISNNTLTFLGSNVVAFGNPGLSKKLLGADVLVNEFIRAIIDGYSAGESISISRVSTYDQADNDDLNYALTTILEFSLYGDPLIMINNGISRMDSNSKFARVFSKKIKSKSIPKSFGILSEVRSLVDTEIDKIRTSVNEYMYPQFNIEPQDLNKVYEITGKFGSRNYNLIYLKKEGQYTRLYSVFTDPGGKITKIYASK